MPCSVVCISRPDGAGGASIGRVVADDSASTTSTRQSSPARLRREASQQATSPTRRSASRCWAGSSERWAGPRFPTATALPECPAAIEGRYVGGRSEPDPRHDRGDRQPGQRSDRFARCLTRTVGSARRASRARNRIPRTRARRLSEARTIDLEKRGRPSRTPTTHGRITYAVSTASGRAGDALRPRREYRHIERGASGRPCRAGAAS